MTRRVEGHIQPALSGQFAAGLRVDIKPGHVIDACREHEKRRCRFLHPFAEHTESRSVVRLQDPHGWWFIAPGEGTGHHHERYQDRTVDGLVPAGHATEMSLGWDFGTHFTARLVGMLHCAPLSDGGGETGVIPEERRNIRDVEGRNDLDRETLCNT